jgi:hypothetical protein
MFVPGKPFQPGLIFVIKVRSLPQSGAPERSFIHVGSDDTRKYWTRLERLARDKHSSLLQILINYGYKRFMTLGQVK